MTEQDWLTSKEPTRMFLHLTQHQVDVGFGETTMTLRPEPLVSDRKFQLFAGACRHSFYHGYLIRRASWSGWESDGHMKSRKRDAVTGPYLSAQAWASELSVDEKPRRAHFLREIVGNPFSDTIGRLQQYQPMHGWLAWNGEVVFRMARAAHDLLLPDCSIAPDRLAVLADALEEAGCDYQDVLSHLRSPGPHVRGCWVLDLMLRKE